MSKYKNCRIVEREISDNGISNQCLRCSNWHDKLKGKNCFKARINKKQTGCANYAKDKDYE